MSWLTKTLSSSIGKKVIMSLTGLFLIVFLAVHMVGNMQLLKSDGGEAFNLYTVFMTTNPLIKTVSYLLYTFIVVHVVYAILLNRQNTAARPQNYAYSKSVGNSTWASRSMTFLGVMTLIFLVIHLKSFWYEMKFGAIDTVMIDGKEVKDLYSVVSAAFAQEWYVAIYVISMVFLGFHLSHGFQSAFQTLGLNHVKYTPIIKKLGVAFSIIVSFLFAIQPIYMYLKSLGVF